MGIRAATIDDLAGITDIYNYYVRETAITFDLEPFAFAEREPWFAQFSNEGRHRIIVLEDDGVIQGYASSGRFRTKDAYLTSVETSVYLRPEQTSKGLGTDLYRALFRLIEDEDIHRAYGGITLPNDASVALHRKFGFKESGVTREVGRKFDRYWDVAWLEKEL